MASESQAFARAAGIDVEEIQEALMFSSEYCSVCEVGPTEHSKCRSYDMGLRVGLNVFSTGVSTKIHCTAGFDHCNGCRNRVYAQLTNPDSRHYLTPLQLTAVKENLVRFCRNIIYNALPDHTAEGLQIKLEDGTEASECTSQSDSSGAESRERCTTFNSYKN